MFDDFSSSDPSAFLFYLYTYPSASQITICLKLDMFKQVVKYPRWGVYLLKHMLMFVVYLA